MSVYVEIITAPTPVIEVVGNGNYNVVVEAIAPIVAEVVGVHYISQIFADTQLVLTNITPQEAQQDFNLS